MMRFGNSSALLRLAVTVTAGCNQSRSTEGASAGAANSPHADPNADGLPTPVLAALKASYPDARIVHHWRDNVDGQRVFEVRLRHACKRIDVAFNAQGDVVEVETPVTESELPATVLESVAARHPDFRFVQAEEVRAASGGRFYEVLLAKTGTSVKSRFDQNGTVVSEFKMQDIK